MDPTIGISSGTTVDTFFSSTASSQDQLNYLSNLTLSRGIDLFTKGKYADAAKQFKSTIGISPTSDYAPQAYDYLTQAYQKLNNTADATKTLKDAIKVFPAADNFHLNLGDIYFKAGKISDAEKEYFKAVQLNPTSSDNRYSLGQAYLTEGRYDVAKAQFSTVTRLSPASATGYYGLGQTNRQMGKYDDAVSALKKAISVDKTFTNAVLELGYTYSDMGDMAKATDQLTILQQKKSSLATNLQSYMTKVAPPKFTTANSGILNLQAGMDTKVSDLSSSLSAPGASEIFTMNFIFSKQMDAASVQNLDNWQISREAGVHIGDEYNFGLPVPSTEVTLQATPNSVVYDSKSNTATVTFEISQNAAGSATIDPSHIAFRFKGNDTYGKTMDPKADEYSGFSKIV